MAQIARKAADLIEENGLTCAELKDRDTGAFCILGAIMEAAEVPYQYGDYEWYGMTEREPNHQASRVVEQLALRLGAEPKLAGRRHERVVYSWSDRHVDDVDEALHLLRSSAVDFEANAFV